MLYFSKTVLKGQDGFFAMLLVAVTSFALWSTMSTMYVYSANKSENLAKIKETADMDGIMADLAVVVRDSFYNHYIENQGKMDGDDCPDNHTKCELSSEESASDDNDGIIPKLCHKTLDGGGCKICLKNFHGQTINQAYCANVTGFGGSDVFGDCAKNDILCASLAIDANDKSNPPATEDDLIACTSCFVQPVKIYLDIEASKLPPPPDPQCTPACTTPTPACCHDGNGGYTCKASCNGGGTCPNTHPHESKQGDGSTEHPTQKGCWSDGGGSGCYVYEYRENSFCKESTPDYCSEINCCDEYGHGPCVEGQGSSCRNVSHCPGFGTPERKAGEDCEQDIEECQPHWCCHLW